MIRFSLLAVISIVFGLAAAPVRADGEPWTSEIAAKHPLVGRIWSPARGDFVTVDEVRAAARSANYLLLGETHTNPDHHRLQASLVATAGEGAPLSVVFEMIPAEYAAPLDAYLARPDASAEGVAEVVEWEKRHWPDWRIYRPIAEAALQAGAPVRAGDLDTTVRKRIGKEGLEALSDEERRRLSLDVGLPASAQEDLKQTLRLGHCGMLPEPAVEAIYKVQRARDAALAEALLQAPTKRAVLIAGNGHVRADYAAPWYLRARLAAAGRGDAEVVTVSFREVEDGEEQPEAYETSALAERHDYDYVWFTPRFDDTDHCAGLRERFSKPATGGSGESGQ